MSLRPVLASLTLVTPLAAQGTITLGEEASLPYNGSNPDHAIVAENARGDLLVVWQTSVSVPGGNAKQAEGVVLRRTDTSEWELPGSGDVIVFGDPTLELSGGRERCKKPRIAAIDNNFAVSWVRVADGSTASALECSRLDVPASGDPVLRQPLVGVGYHIDGAFTSGLSGETADIARKSIALGGGAAPGTVVFVNVHEIDGGGTTNDYEIRGWWADFGRIPPRVRGPVILGHSIGADEEGSEGLGRIPPFIVEDDQGGVVVAFESYLSSDRFGVSTDRGRVYVRRFEVNSSSVTQTGQLILYGDHSSHLQRRPVLSTSRIDGDDHIALSWTEMDTDGSDRKGHYGIVEVNGNGTLDWNDLSFALPSNYTINGLAPLLEEPLRLAVVSADRQQTPRLLFWDGQAGQEEIVQTFSDDVSRPSAVLSREPGSGGSGMAIPTVFDAEDPGSGARGIFIRIEED